MSTALMLYRSTSSALPCGGFFLFALGIVSTHLSRFAAKMGHPAEWLNDLSLELDSSNDEKKADEPTYFRGAASKMRGFLATLGMTL